MLVSLPLLGVVLMQSVWMLLLCPSAFRYWGHLWLKTVSFTFDWLGSRGQAAPAQLSMWGQQQLPQTLLGGGVAYGRFEHVNMCVYAWFHTGTEEKAWKSEAEHCQLSQSQLRGKKGRRRGEHSEQHHLLGESRACNLPATMCAWPYPKLDTKVREGVLQALLDYEQGQTMPLPWKKGLTEITSELPVQSWNYSSAEDSSKALAGQFSI